jgi:hypothetical protein
MGDPRRLRRTGDCRTKMFRRDTREGDEEWEGRNRS